MSYQKLSDSYMAGVLNLVKVFNAELVCYQSGVEAIRLTVVNESSHQRRFLIFTNNLLLMETLGDILSRFVDIDEATEKDLIGLEFFLLLQEQNGYLNIIDVVMPSNEARK